MEFKIVQPQGMLDGIRANELRQQISEVLTGETKTVLIDLQDVNFMDSSGLSALVSVLKMIKTAGGKLYLCSINEQLQMVFELTRMDRVFETFSNRDEFLHFLSS